MKERDAWIALAEEWDQERTAREQNEKKKEAKKLLEIQEQILKNTEIILAEQRTQG